MSIEAIGAPAPPVAMDVQPAPPAAAAAADTSKQAGLHSPPDSNVAMDPDGSDSELSELDELADKLGVALSDDELAEELNVVEPKVDAAAPEPEAAPAPQPAVEDIGEVLPDHWSGTVPVFKPTMKQFQDFKLFMEKVDKYGMKSGIIKIIAPQEWKDSLPPVDDLIKQIRVREPIKQDIMGSNGTYRQVNILHQRSYNLPQWRQLCDQSEHQPPARRGERRANSDRKPATRSRPAAEPKPRPAPASTPAKKRKGGGRVTRRSTRAAKEETEEPEDRPMTPVSPAPEKTDVMDSVEKDAEVKEEQCEEEEDEPPVVRRMGFSRQSKPKTQSTSARRKYIRREGSAMIDEAAFKDWDYQMDISDYTPERCEELEKTYWKTLTYAPPLYGADLPGTLFDDSVKMWNLDKLPNLLDVLGTKVPGVNTAYLYLGMWKATFAWHLEDVDLYSINYLHFGAPKQWYSISQADARRFEAAMKNIWPTEAKACDQFLRHKAFLISPSHLKQQYNITVNKCVSYPGEFVVTYPYGYHSGYNLGYNCAEAVNFALDSWLPMGKIAKKCQCAQAQDSVWVDVYEIERKLRGEETEYEETEDEEDEEDDEDQDTGLPSPPSSHTAKGKGRKRKRDAADKEPRAKTKKIRLRLKAHVEPPCCLCPNDIPGAQIMPTDDGRKAHRMCALYLPETYIETVDGEERIANVANIDKARLGLKCLYCRSKKGACFQCSQKKCPRSYHATCAAAAGIFVEEGEVPVFGEDGTEYKEQAFEFSCRFHRTKRDRKLDGDALENNPQIREAAKALKKDDVCQMQYFRGEIFAGVVVENRPDEETFLVDIIPNGDRVEVEWKWLLLPDPADFRLPKASANAIPMPTCRKAQQEINAKRAVDEAPRKGDEFGPGFVWAEFHAGDPGRNKGQAKIDFSKENQVWHYLGKTSTEAKAQYTEDPSKPWHNPKGNFLDTLPKPPPPVRAPPPPRPAPPPPGAYPMYAAVPGGQPTPGPAPKQAKPYVYKPRKPAASTSQHPPPQFTSHMFSIHPSPQQSPAFQHYQPPQMQSRPPPPQPVFQHHVFPQHPQHHSHQMPQQQPPPLQVKQYQAPGLEVQRKTSSSSSAPHSSDRFAPVGGSNGFPQLPGLSWPPAHMKSGHSVQPQSRAWASSSAGAAVPVPHPAPMTASALRSPSDGQPQPGAAGDQPHASAYQKYSFFRVNHNRDSLTYRTPYGQWGGFTNGYEGNLREFLMNAQNSLSGGSGKGPIKQVPASLLQPLRPRLEASPGPGTPPYPAHSSPYAQILPRPQATPPHAPPFHGYPATPQQPQYHSHGYPPQATPGGQPWEMNQPQLHPSNRPQYGTPPHPQRPSPGPGPGQHVWQAVPQPPPPAPTPAQTRPAPAKQPLTKQSHSPIPLPPYVKQMAAATAKPSPLRQAAGQQQKAAPQQATQQATQQAPQPAPQPAPQNPFSAAPGGKAPPAPLLPKAGVSPPSAAAKAGQLGNGPQAGSQGGSAPPPGNAQQPGPVPQPQPGNAPFPQATPQPGDAPQLVDASQPGSQQGTAQPVPKEGQDNEALVEKMMMNLRRASLTFGRLDGGEGKGEGEGETQQGEEKVEG